MWKRSQDRKAEPFMSRRSKRASMRSIVAKFADDGQDRDLPVGIKIKQR